LPNTVLRPKSKRKLCLGQGWVAGVAGVVFGVTVILILTVFTAMLWFGAKGTWSCLAINPEFRFAVGFTLQSTFLATVGTTLTALPCAWILARKRFRGKILVELLFDLPIVLPPLISGVALLILFGPVLGAGLSKFGLRVVFSPLGVVVAQWFIALPFAVKMFREAFAGVDPRYEKVARTLGGSADVVFFRVTLPMAGRGIGAGVAMAWARTLGEFGATAMLAGVTRMKTETLAAAVFLNMSIGELQSALGIAVVMFLAAVAVLLLFQIMLGGRRRL
jgi:molybdate transport system permease protein